MRVAVIVVNYGTAELSANAVDSVLAAHNPELEVETHLVDNASPGDDAARLRDMAELRGWGERVTLWPEATNHGFGGGNNVVLHALAARPVPPDFVFLLNPDAALTNDALLYLVKALEADPKAAAAGAAIADADGAPEAAAFRFPTLASELTRMIDFGPLSRIMGRFRVALSPTLPRREVDWVSGAAVMFRFQSLKEADFFDPGFFLYYEEVDLMRRLSAAGWRVLHVPEAKVMHHAGVSTGIGRRDNERRRNPPYLYHSWKHYFSKSFGRRRTLFLALILLPAAALNVLIYRVRGRAPSIPRNFFQDHWRYAVRPLLGRGEPT